MKKIIHILGIFLAMSVMSMAQIEKNTIVQTTIENGIIEMEIDAREN